jgi:hypothetical protein
MHHLYPISGEVIRVERQYTTDAVDVHRRNQPRVMHFDALNAVPHHQPLPFAVHRRAVGQQFHRALDLLYFTERHSSRDAHAVGFERPGQNIPELGDILQRVIDRLAGHEQAPYAFDRDAILRTAGLRSAQQNIGIDEDTHTLAATGIDNLPAHRFI